MDSDLVQSMNSKTTEDVTQGNACWETPPEIFTALYDEFHFDIDLTGGPGTQHRMEHWLGPGSPWKGKLGDALTSPWHKLTIRGTPIKSGFSNPPYGKFIPLIMEQAYKEAQEGFTSVFLLPNRVTRWYKNAMRHASEIRIVDERIAFWENGHPRWNVKILTETGAMVPDPAMFDSCLVIVRPPSADWYRGSRGLFRRPAEFDLWHWDPERRKRCTLHA